MDIFTFIWNINIHKVLFINEKSKVYILKQTFYGLSVCWQGHRRTKHIYNLTISRTTTKLMQYIWHQALVISTWAAGTSASGQSAARPAAWACSIGRSSVARFMPTAPSMSTRAAADTWSGLKPPATVSWRSAVSGRSALSGPLWVLLNITVWIANINYIKLLMKEKSSSFKHSTSTSASTSTITALWRA